MTFMERLLHIYACLWRAQARFNKHLIEDIILLHLLNIVMSGQGGLQLERRQTHDEF